MGKRKLLKPAQKLKYCIEKTYKVDLQSSDSELDENNKYIMFVSCLVGRTARNNLKIHFLYGRCSNFNYFTTERKVIEFGASNCLVKSRRA